VQLISPSPNAVTAGSSKSSFLEGSLRLICECLSFHPKGSTAIESLLVNVPEFRLQFSAGKFALQLLNNY
jgi:hypothetical protein